MPEQREHTRHISERERSVESRESKETREAEIDPELAMAAMKERAEFLIKEVKSNRQQVQNILMHMVQVQTTINQIRQQLALASSEDSSSLTHDTARVEKLRTQIREHSEELLKMKEDLVQIAIRELEAAGTPESHEALEIRARQQIQELLHPALDGE